ncbi:MAG: hypothetical protein ACC633_09635 [Anaerolineales bacterium]
MFVSNAYIVIAGAIILIVGLYFAIRSILILRIYGLARSWIVLTVLIAFFFFGYIFTALMFLGIELVPSVTLEGIVTEFSSLGRSLC